MSSHPDHSHHGGFFIGAVVGGVLGAMATMLFTTEQGRKMQHQAAEKYHDLEMLAKKIIHRRASKAAKRRKR